MGLPNSIPSPIRVLFLLLVNNRTVGIGDCVSLAIDCELRRTSKKNKPVYEASDSKKKKH